MDPISTAVLAFGAIKKGISMGKELHSMSKDINNLFAFIDGAKEAKKKGKKGDPLSDYIAYEKAMDFEKQLRDIIIETRGMKGWAKFESMRKQAKQVEAEGRYKAIRRRNEIKNALSIFLGIIIFSAGAGALIYFASKFADR